MDPTHDHHVPMGPPNPKHSKTLSCYSQVLDTATVVVAMSCCVVAATRQLCLWPSIVVILQRLPALDQAHDDRVCLPVFFLNIKASVAWH